MDRFGLNGLPKVSARMQWYRLSPLEPADRRLELWSLREGNVELRSLSVDVTYGKPLDIVSLKAANIREFATLSKSIAESRRAVFSGELERVETCAVCGADTSNARPALLDVHGADYVECASCSHRFVAARPSKAALDKFYAESTEYQRTYADPATLELRVAQVATPKVDWIVQTFEARFGRKPSRILDVGAGSGHFVYACRKAGFHADGVEISASGSAFAKANFGVDMIDLDFLERSGELGEYDIITFWGVIEHVPFPKRFLETASKLARRVTSGEALVVAEVPRWHGLGTAVQSQTRDTVIRHLDPVGHINVFSDSSLMSAFDGAELDVCAAWYFGMDAYELIVQLEQLTGSENAGVQARAMIPHLQAALDGARLSDEVTFAATVRR